MPPAGGTALEMQLKEELARLREKLQAKAETQTSFEKLLDSYRAQLTEAEATRQEATPSAEAEAR